MADENKYLYKDFITLKETIKSTNVAVFALKNMISTVFFNSGETEFPSMMNVLKIISNYEDIPDNMVLCQEYEFLEKPLLYEKMRDIYLDSLGEMIISSMDDFK